MPSCHRNSNLLVMTANVPGVRSEREEGGGDGQTANIPIGVNQLLGVTPKQLFAMRFTVGKVENI